MKTFGENTPKLQTCEVVQRCTRSQDGLDIYTTCYVLQICHPISCQVIDIAKAQYSYLQGLSLSDNPTAEQQNEMPIDILVGSDQYWAFIEGSIIQGDLPGPVATLTKLGYVLSGPMHCQGNNQLNNELSWFWELEHIGIQKQEPGVYDKFVQEIKFVDNRYQISLPFKDSDNMILPNNFSLNLKRLKTQVQRLKSYKTDIFKEYHSVICEQLEQGVVAHVHVAELKEPCRNCSDHLPHRKVLRTDRATTKLRAVYDG